MENWGNKSGRETNRELENKHAKPGGNERMIRAKNNKEGKKKENTETTTY